MPVREKATKTQQDCSSPVGVFGGSPSLVMTSHQIQTPKSTASLLLARPVWGPSTTSSDFCKPFGDHGVFPGSASATQSPGCTGKSYCFPQTAGCKPRNPNVVACMRWAGARGGWELVGKGQRNIPPSPSRGSGCAQEDPGQLRQATPARAVPPCPSCNRPPIRLGREIRGGPSRWNDKPQPRNSSLSSSHH